MSFSNNVKDELCRTLSDKDRRFSCLYGLVLFSRHITADMICFQTKSQVVAEIFPKLLSETFSVSLSSKYEKSKENAFYTYTINDSDKIKLIIDGCRIKQYKLEINLNNVANNSIGAFVSGVFLSCGSVTDPNKEYHLEFVIYEKQLYEDLERILSSLGFGMKMVMRKNAYILYIKGSEEIEDMLTFMGAQQSTLDMMNVKIFKDVRNKANRIANCDSANIDKVINAATRQLNDIRLIDEKVGLYTLPLDLLEVAELRLENPELSLKEIGEALSKPLHRSGVNHRFQKIAKIAENLR